MPLGALAAPAQRTIYPPCEQSAIRQICNAAGDPCTQIKLYNGTGGALTANRLYVVTLGGTTATAPNPRVAAPATSSVQKYYVVSSAATADASYDWFTLWGYCTLGLEGTSDISAGDWLKAVNAQVYAVVDGAAQTAASIGLALEAQAANSVVEKTVFLYGERCTL